MARKICFSRKKRHCLSAKREMTLLATVLCRFFKLSRFWPTEDRLQIDITLLHMLFDMISLLDAAVGKFITFRSTSPFCPAFVSRAACFFAIHLL